MDSGGAKVAELPLPLNPVRERRLPLRRSPMTLPPTQRNLDLRRRLRALAPLIPLADSEPVLEQAAKLMRQDLGLGAALWLAMVAHVRHRHTGYEALLAEGYDRDAARHFVVEETETTLRRWGCTKQIVAEAEDQA